MGVSSEMRVSLELARELNGLKQSEAAQKIGVSTDTLGNYERGKSYPDIPILRKIGENVNHKKRAISRNFRNIKKEEKRLSRRRGMGV